MEIVTIVITVTECFSVSELRVTEWNTIVCLQTNCDITPFIDTFRTRHVSGILKHFQSIATLKTRSEIYKFASKLWRNLITEWSVKVWGTFSKKFWVESASRVSRTHGEPCIASGVLVRFTFHEFDCQVYNEGINQYREPRRNLTIIAEKLLFYSQNKAQIKFVSLNSTDVMYFYAHCAGMWCV